MAIRTTIHFFVKSELLNVVPNDQQLAIIPGETIFGDTAFRWYKYDVSSSTTHDGEEIIKPTSVVGNGRWLKQTNFQTPVDWNAVTGFQEILNKPDLSQYMTLIAAANVATSGDYNDLSNKPSIPSTQVNSDWNSISGVSQITNKPSLATVATSGVYGDLSGKPTIITHTDLSGSSISVTKWATGTVSPSTGNGYSIDISGVGFTNVIGYSVEAIKNTATPTSAPKVSIKSISSTAIVVNIIEGNSSTVNILGSLVLLGTSEQFAITTGLTLKVSVWGN